jgi:hypothetical protein
MLMSQSHEFISITVIYVCLKNYNQIVQLQECNNLMTGNYNNGFFEHTLNSKHPFHFIQKYSTLKNNTRSFYISADEKIRYEIKFKSSLLLPSIFY